MIERLIQIKKIFGSMPKPFTYIVSGNVPDVGDDGEPLIVRVPSYLSKTDGVGFIPQAPQCDNMVMSPKTARQLADKLEERGNTAEAKRLRELAELAEDQ